MSERICSVEDCDRVARAKGWCQKHYYALRPQTCTYRGCTGRLKARGYCTIHDREFDMRQRPCPECGETFSGHARRRYCSVWCKAQANRSPMRRAVEAGDGAAIIAAASTCSVVSDAGCWEWQFAKTQGGYGVIGQGGRGGLVHRHVAQATVGRPIGDEPVHHKCANRACVNPDHLQLTTARENAAEMFSRTFLVRRIASLEAALMELNPTHPLLTSTAT